MQEEIKLTEEQLAEAQRRSEEVATGKVKTIPWNEIEQKLEERYEFPENWKTEIDRRMERFEKGETRAIPWKEVMDKYLKMKCKSRLFVFFCFAASLVFSNCSSKEETEAEPECEHSYFAEVFLYEEFKNFSPPYDVNETAIFKDSLGEDVPLNRFLTADDFFFVENYGIFCDNGFSIGNYYLEQDFDLFSLNTEFDDIRFTFKTNVSSLPESYRNFTLDTLLFDELTLRIRHQDSDKELEFRIYGERTYELPPEFIQNQDFDNENMEKIDLINVGGSFFTDVLSFENENGRMMFNGEYGLIMFEFFDVGRWEFDRF